MSTEQPTPQNIDEWSEEELEAFNAEREAQLRESLETEAMEATAEQRELLDSLDEAHGGDIIETPVTLPGDNLAHIEVVLNGELISRMATVDETLSTLSDPEPGDLSNVERAMNEAAGVLADITVEEKFSREVFYAVYDRYGPEALGEHIETAFDAIETAAKQKAGDVKGFRG